MLKVIEFQYQLWFDNEINKYELYVAMNNNIDLT